jgi:subtilisin family serine protease
VPGARSVRTLASVGATAVKTKRQDSAKLWASVRGSGKGIAAGGIQKIALDGPVTAALFKSVPQIGAPAAWNAGFTGAGAKVAVLDMGVDATHPDLKNVLADSKDFSGTGDTGDGWVGHGTHVATTIAGSGAASPAGQLHKGVAPGAKILNGKVLDDAGSGSESQVVAGIEWAVSKGAKVINMSLGFAPGGVDNIVTAAVNKASTQNGVLSVVSAGNDGELAPGGVRTITASPADAETALTVGAVDSQNNLASFSSRGPRLSDDGVKPEITAPGVQISAGNNTVDAEVDGNYRVMSGTSMAAPHVAGALAILRGMGLAPQAAIDRLIGTARDLGAPGRDGTFGAGLIDVARAAQAGPIADPTTTAPGSTSTAGTAAPGTTGATAGPSSTQGTAPAPGTLPSTDKAAPFEPSPGDDDDPPAALVALAIALLTVTAAGSAATAWRLRTGTR